MSKYKAIFQRSRLASTTFLVACLILLGAGVLATHPKSRQEFEPRIVNKTRALEIVSASRSFQGQLPTLEVTLKNVSSKNIVAYTLLMGNIGDTRDYAFSEKLLGPSETDIEIIPLEGLKTASAITPPREADVIVSAVWFEGHDGDGDPKQVAMLKDKYRGLKEQAQHILPLLHKAVEASGTSPDQALDELELQTSSLSSEGDSPTQSLDYKSGMNLARKHLGVKIREIRSKKKVANNIDQKMELNSLIASYERILARF